MIGYSLSIKQKDKPALLNGTVANQCRSRTLVEDSGPVFDVAVHFPVVLEVGPPDEGAVAKQPDGHSLHRTKVMR